MIRRCVLALLLLAGCNPTPPTSFYTLASRPLPETDGEAAQAGMMVALAPIALPAYLERPQVVTRIDATRMRIADFDSWIEPLDTLIQRTLAANLQGREGVAQVVRLPQRRPVPFDRGVEVGIDRFEATAAGEVWMDADWVVIDAAEREVARATFVRRSVIPAPGGFAEQSVALSALLDELSATIAQALGEGR